LEFPLVRRPGIERPKRERKAESSRGERGALERTEGGVRSEGGARRREEEAMRRREKKERREGERSRSGRREKPIEEEELELLELFAHVGSAFYMSAKVGACSIRANEKPHITLIKQHGLRRSLLERERVNCAGMHALELFERTEAP